MQEQTFGHPKYINIIKLNRRIYNLLYINFFSTRATGIARIPNNVSTSHHIVTYFLKIYILCFNFLCKKLTTEFHYFRTCCSIFYIVKQDCINFISKIAKFTFLTINSICKTCNTHHVFPFFFLSLLFFSNCISAKLQF